MPTSTFTVTQADGSSETYTITRNKFIGVREMEVDGVDIFLDRTSDIETRNMFIDGVPISVNNYFPATLPEVVGYFQPNGSSRYLQPNGSSFYQIP